MMMSSYVKPCAREKSVAESRPSYGVALRISCVITLLGAETLAPPPGDATAEAAAASLDSSVDRVEFASSGAASLDSEKERDLGEENTDSLSDDFCALSEGDAGEAAAVAVAAAAGSTGEDMVGTVGWGRSENCARAGTNDGRRGSAASRSRLRLPPAERADELENSRGSVAAVHLGSSAARPTVPLISSTLPAFSFAPWTATAKSRVISSLNCSARWSASSSRYIFMFSLCACDLLILLSSVGRSAPRVSPQFSSFPCIVLLLGR